jgi:hypothetical protein
MMRADKRGLLVAQRFDGIEARGFPCGVDTGPRYWEAIRFTKEDGGERLCSPPFG